MSDNVSMEEIGLLLTTARIAADKTQKEIAKELGLANHNVLSMIEKGRSRVPFNRALDFCFAYEIPHEMVYPIIKANHPEIYEPLSQIISVVPATASELAMGRHTVNVVMSQISMKAEETKERKEIESKARRKEKQRISDAKRYEEKKRLRKEGKTK